jgi:hypothetical protein
MRELQIIYQNQEKIIKKLNTGNVDAIELAVDQITDEFMIYGFLCFGYRVAQWSH